MPFFGPPCISGLFQTLKFFVKYYLYVDNIVQYFLFFSEIDVNHTCYWTATASVYSSEGSVFAEFTPAPVSFGFSVYNIFLISGPLVIRNLTISTSDDVSLLLLLIIR